MLTADSELLLYSSGPLDTVGEVLKSDGGSLGSANDGSFPDNPWNFVIRAYLGPGTYYVSVAGNAGATGSYELHVEILSDDVGNSLPSAAAISPGAVTGGRIGRPGDTSSYDADYYKLEFSSPTDFYVVAFSATFITGQLLDANGNVLSTSSEFFLESELFGHHTFGSLENGLGFMLRGTGAAGTYYIRVRGSRSSFTGVYVMQVGAAPNPGSSLNTATPIPSAAAAPGRISSSSDADYFSVSFDESTYASVVATILNDVRPMEITVYDDQDAASISSRWITRDGIPMRGTISPSMHSVCLRREERTASA